MSLPFPGKVVQRNSVVHASSHSSQEMKPLEVIAVFN
jgi:hypothetical protein